MYYRRRISNKELSGPYAYLNGKRIIWEESHDSVNWMPSDITWKRVGIGSIGLRLTHSAFAIFKSWQSKRKERNVRGNHQSVPQLTKEQEAYVLRKMMEHQRTLPPDTPIVERVAKLRSLKPQWIREAQEIGQPNAL